MKRIGLCISAILIIFPISLSALTITETIVMEFGKAGHQIGIDKGGGEHWKPLFFDVDQQGTIHIPDFYKARIAVFNRQGTLIREISCNSGISPRMNYFTLAPRGMYVTYGDYTLSVISGKGTILWSTMTGYGVIPRFIRANSVGIFFVAPGPDQRAFIFDYSSDQPLGRFGFMDGDKGIPMIATEQNSQFTFTLKDMARIPENTYPKGAFDPGENAYLVYVDKKNNSLWKTRKDKIEYYYLYSDKGSLVKKGTISFPDTGVSGTGFWTICDENLSIYKNYFYENHMEIVVYEFE